MSCFWSCNWERWSNVESRQWEIHGSPDQKFVRHVQRRMCKRCGLIEEREL